MEPMPRVLFVHQSADLYGSDRVLHTLVTGLTAYGYRPIVLLPVHGPLYDLLISSGVETYVIGLTTLRRTKLGLLGLLSLPFSLMASLIRIRRLVRGQQIRFIYSNTLAVLSGAVYAKLARITHVWHVHEIVIAPTSARKGFPMLLSLLADQVICNSRLTRQWLVGECPRLAKRILTIWNGVARPLPFDRAAATEFRRRVGATDHDLVVTLVGRINRWKGQSLLVEAAEILHATGFVNLRFAMIGGAPAGQEHFAQQLRGRIDQSPARESIVLLGYREDIWTIWDGSDIAVVPSVEPEPFGLVAIEAMAAGKPVIVAAHGGLLDIVEHQKSGLLVNPGDPQDLAAAIARLCEDRVLRQTLAHAGQCRQKTLFSIAGQIDETIRCLEKLRAA